jgi:hypothetical protein
MRHFLGFLQDARLGRNSVLDRIVIHGLELGRHLKDPREHFLRVGGFWHAGHHDCLLGCLSDQRRRLTLSVIGCRGLLAIVKRWVVHCVADGTILDSLT